MPLLHHMNDHGYVKIIISIIPKLLMKHHTNNNRMKKQTFYNELSAIRSRVLLATVLPYGEELTLFGRKKLVRLIHVIER